MEEEASGAHGPSFRLRVTEKKKARKTRTTDISGESNGSGRGAAGRRTRVTMQSVNVMFLEANKSTGV